MSLEHAIQGFLTCRPLSGYDLKKFFDETVRHFWSAPQSQIYRTLARMAETGWVEMERIKQEDRPDRKVYHVTGEGRDELRRWLRRKRGSSWGHLVVVSSYCPNRCWDPSHIWYNCH